jgi:hypothetical protein
MDNSAAGRLTACNVLPSLTRGLATRAASRGRQNDLVNSLRRHLRRAEVVQMTPAQELEMQRFTYTKWTLLRYAGRLHPIEAEVYGPLLRTARILERHGFLSVTGEYRVRLTEAGHEAIRNIPRRYLPTSTGA